MFVYVSPGSSFKKRRGGGRGLNFAKIQVAFQFIFNFNWKSNTGKGEKIYHVFFTKSIHLGGEGHCQPNFKKQLLIGMSIFFSWLNSCACIFFFNILSFYTWQWFFCLSAPCCPPTIISMGLVSRTRIANDILHITRSFLRLLSGESLV